MASAFAVPLVAKPAGPSVPEATAVPAGDVFSKYGLVVHERAEWIAKKTPSPKGLETERDVRVLLVHHSDSGNTYKAGAVPSVLRGFHSFHTGPEKKWPDIAYNFFVDRFGDVWEGRHGSLERPVIGSASGGNQGHSQLVCLIGNFASERPPTRMLASLAALLAALGERYELDPDPDATSTFVSRGSNRWPKGKEVSTRSIEGHRAMSMTACPGDAAFAALPDVRLAVKKLRG